MFSLGPAYPTLVCSEPSMLPHIHVCFCTDSVLSSSQLITTIQAYAKASSQHHALSWWWQRRADSSYSLPRPQSKECLCVPGTDSTELQLSGYKSDFSKKSWTPGEKKPCLWDLASFSGPSQELSRMLSQGRYRINVLWINKRANGAFIKTYFYCKASWMPNSVFL